MVKDLGLEVDRKNTFDHSVRGVSSAVTPSNLCVVVEIEDRALFSVFRLTDGGVEVVIERVDKPLSSCGACRCKTFSEPEEKYRAIAMLSQ